MAPPSQKHRRIGFHLSGGTSFPARFDLNLRPEELTLNEVSRLTVQETLGGNYADSYGRGVSSVTLAGHNGWKGGLLSSGEDLFYQLRDTVFINWHEKRDEARMVGRDPNSVRLTLVDTLDDLDFLVAPKSFQLRRSKSSPLLMRYQIQLVVLDDSASSAGILDQIVKALSNPLRWIAGVTGLGNIIGLANGLLNDVRTILAIPALVRGAIGQLAGVGLNLIGEVRDSAQEFRGVFDERGGALLTVGKAYTKAVRSVMVALAADESLSDADRFTLSRTASVFWDAHCSMANSFSAGRYFRSYEDLFGASNCSSTGGGREWSPYAAPGINSFERVLPPAPTAISMTSEASAAVRELSGDPFLLVGQQERIASLAVTAAEGVTL
jgi:hypothetical protein